MAIIRISSTAELIAAANTEALVKRRDFWRYMQYAKFNVRYHQALLEAGVEQSKADEIAEVMKVYIDRIADALESAVYTMRELIAEAEDARRRANTPQSGNARFTL